MIINENVSFLCLSHACLYTKLLDRSESHFVFSQDALSSHIWRLISQCLCDENEAFSAYFTSITNEKVKMMFKQRKENSWKSMNEWMNESMENWCRNWFAKLRFGAFAPRSGRPVVVGVTWSKSPNSLKVYVH